MDIYNRANEAKYFIESICKAPLPKIALVLGTGLNVIREDFEVIHAIPYDDIPHFPKGTVKSHDNLLLVASIHGVEIILLVGRFHYYEGFSMKEISFPIRVLQQLDVNQIIFTNAVGGLNPNYNAGDLAMVRDHIYLMPDNPLRGKNDDRLGVRFPDMSLPYDLEMQRRFRKAADNQGVRLHSSVYVCWQGPSLETPAEYAYLNKIGADLVGMSTIPEVIVARHAGIRVAVISIITNQCFPIELIKETSIDEVIEVANTTAPKLKNILIDFLNPSFS